MDVLTFIVAVVLVAGVFSAMHGLFKPVAGWMYPSQATPAPAAPATPAQRQRRADRLLLVLAAAAIVGTLLRFVI